MMPMQIRKGQRLPLTQIFQGAEIASFKIQVGIGGLAGEVDFACFGIDGRQSLSDDRYMTFFNQPETPCGSVSISVSQHAVDGFNLRLDHLPDSIRRLVITAAIDGNETMQAMRAGFLRFVDAAGRTVAEFVFQGSDFNNEKALMLGEFYRSGDEWRFGAIAQGFDGGLAALVSHFGGKISDQPAQATAGPASAQKISLEKKIATAAPKLVALAKKAAISLEKRKLSHIVARVGLILDASGSMRRQYSEGKVQEVINRILPLAVHFDDDGELDIWAFSSRSLALPAANLQNYEHYVSSIDGGWKEWKMMSFNNEPEVIGAALSHYQSTDLPVFIIFISDGGVDQDKKIKSLLVEAAKRPIFWQFVGIGGRNYGILEKLDTMSGRLVDNCGFFALDDLHSISEQDLYDRLLQEFPVWLAEAKNKGIFS